MVKLFGDGNRTNYLAHFLVALTGIGLTGKLFMALTIGLNSDSVVPGLQAMAIFRHGNIFLSGFFFSENYSAIFTDLVPFYLLSQLISNYNPLVLKLTGFVVYALVVLIFSLLIYRLTNDRIKALMFAALFSNLGPLASEFFLRPVSHVATLLFCGMIFYLLLDFEKIKLQNKVALAVVIFLLTLSDKLFLVILPLSFMIAYTLYLVSQKKITFRALAVPFLGILMPAAIAYELIPMIPGFVQRAVLFYPAYLPSDRSLYFLYSRTISYFVNLAQVVSDDLYSMAFGLIGIRGLIGLALAALFLYGALNLYKNVKKDDAGMRLLLLFLIISNVLLFLAFVVTNVDNTGRYLLFTAVSLLIVIGLGYNGNKLYLALFSIVAVTGVISCAAYIAASSADANAEQYDLIGYLEDHDINDGFAGYWDANVITYLSGENVRLRAVTYNEDTLIPYLWLSDADWYADMPQNFSILYNKNNNGSENGGLGAWHNDINVTPAFRYGNYSIYKAHLTWTDYLP